MARAAAHTLDAARAALEAMLGRSDALRAIEAARKPAPVIQSKRYVPGLVTAFLASRDFGQLKPTTQREYRRYLDAFRTEFPEFRTDDLDVTDLISWRDELAAHPRAA